MSGHTPGPWEWVRVQPEGFVAEHTLKGPSVLCRYWYDKPLTADALLIAAAPETAAERDRLLAVNAELITALTVMLRDCPPSDNMPMLWNNLSARKFATDALAKAATEVQP